MPHSTTPAKVSKPRPDFPLFPHASGRWAKKVRGQFHYFGYYRDDPKGETALNLWLDQKDELLAGRVPRAGTTGGTTVETVANEFMACKDSLRQSDEITEGTYQEYLHSAKRLATSLGHKTPVDTLVADDFRRLRAAIAKRWGPVRLANEIQRIRSIFKFGFDAGLIDRPPRYGADFNKPSAKVLRKARRARGLRMFEREELLAVLEVACPITKAIVLLGINCAFGNTDVGHLPLSAVDLKRGWITYPRRKTEIERKIPLWPETIAALNAVRRSRGAPNNHKHDQLFFVSTMGSTFQPDGRSYWIAEAIRAALIKAKKVRPGLSFYALRHTFQTIGEGSRDLPAVHAIMGHAPAGNDMDATYRERVDDERLQATVEHVRKWLWPAAEATKESEPNGEGGNKQ